MRKSKRRSVLIIVLVSLIAVIMAFMAMNGLFEGLFAVAESKKDSGYFKGYSDGMDDELLHKVTRLSEESEDSPSITILVHGQGGDASHWSNDGEVVLDKNGKETSSYYFEQSEDSIIEGLINSAQVNGEVNLYWAKFETNSDFYLMDLNGLDEYYEAYYDDDTKLTKIEDVSKHAIIVFESSSPYDLHRVVYEELHTMIDKISYDYLVLTGRIPTVNLISHSRGGITSLMYAAGYREDGKIANSTYQNEVYSCDSFDSNSDIIHDHPYNVKELYSMGTPYWGTDWDTMFFGIAHSILPDSFNSASASNILDEDVQQELYECWEAAVAKNNNLQLHAISGVMDPSFIIGLIAEDWEMLSSFIGDEICEQIEFYLELINELTLPINVLVTAVEAVAIGSAVSSLVSIVYGGKTLTFVLSSAVIVVLEVARSLVNSLSAKISKIEGSISDSTDYDNETLFALIADTLSVVTDLVSTFNELVGFVMGDSTYNVIEGWGDFFIDTSSQSAEGYSNVTEFQKVYKYTNITFKAEDGQYRVENVDRNFEFNRNIPSVGIPHNLETLDAEIIEYIVSAIEMDTPETIYKYGIVNDGTTKSAVIEDYSLPSYFTFKTDSNGDYVIDLGGGDTVTYCLNLTAGIAGYPVTEIRNRAFCDMKELSEITLPSELVSIGEEAFKNCTSLKTFIVEDGSELAYISESAFVGTGITEFKLSDTDNFTWIDGILVDNNTSNGSKIALYANASSKQITIPDGVKILGGYLFYGNQNIETVDLNGTEHIGVYTFAESSVSNLTNADNVVYANLSAFSSTPWLNKQSGDYIVIGQVLLAYTGNDAQIDIPEGVSYIGNDAFGGDNITSVVLPSTITELGQEVLAGCPNLEWILFKSTMPPILDGSCFDSDVTIYVKATSLNYYLNNSFFENLENDICSKEVEVQFYDQYGDYLGSTVEEYYSTFDKYISAPSETGYEFKYWLDEYGSFVYVYDIFNYYGDISLTAYYEPSEYEVTINNGNKAQTIYIEYGSTVNLGIPIKAGYVFNGWYDSQTGGNQIIDETGVCVWERTNEVEVLYAQFTLIVYTITYVSERGNFIGDCPTTFTVESPVTTSDISEIRAFGWVFNGWQLNGKEFTTTFNTYENITLTASWLGTTLKYTKSSPSEKITTEYALIDLTSATVSGTYCFYISTTVKYVTFFGTTSKTFKNMRIIVSGPRTSALVIGFSNMNFYPTAMTSGGTGYDAVYAPDNCELYIIYEGTNNITGGAGGAGTDGKSKTEQAQNNNNGSAGENGKDGGDGGNGITAWKVYLTQFDDDASITITGGAGGAGGGGANGQKGSDGVQSPNGSFLKPKKGDNGANGGAGGNGGNGGNGGYAIKVGGSTYLKVTDAANYVLRGGAGGNGGAGGTGGAGGAGASDTSSNIFTGVGDPGDGGNGGCGGNGGNGGNGSLGTNALYVYSYGGAGGAAGAGGSGGTAGAGGDAGKYGDDGDNGKSGTAGSKGTAGTKGSTGYNIKGTNGGIVTVPYLFDKDVMTELFA